MADELETESLFAAIGLGPILAAKPTLYKKQLQQAADLPASIRRRILKFIAADAFQPGKDVPEFNYGDTLKTLSASVGAANATGGLNPAQSNALMAVVPDRELAMDMGIRATAILTWANPLLPRESRPAVIGTRPEDPGPNSMADFRRVWQVALDPMVVLDDLEDGSLSDDQVAALALLYPAIYGEIREAIVEQMATMEARRGEQWEPAPQKAQLLKMLRQEQEIDTTLAAAIQQIYAQQPKPPTAPTKRQGGARGAPAVEDAQTPGQRASGGV